MPVERDCLRWIIMSETPRLRFLYRNLYSVADRHRYFSINIYLIEMHVFDSFTHSRHSRFRVPFSSPRECEMGLLLLYPEVPALIRCDSDL